MALVYLTERGVGMPTPYTGQGSGQGSEQGYGWGKERALGRLSA